MISLKNVNKYYNKNKPNQLHVLKNINLDIDKNGLVALYGKSGSGKTTLLNCIGGIDNFNSGSLFVENFKLNNIKVLNEYKRKNIGFIFQDYCLIENESIEENIMIGMDISDIKRSTEKVNTVLEAVGMSKYNKRKINTLSGGQKQRIAIARALAISPKIILADEPTGNLDKKNTLLILNILKQISEEILVIIVSHEREIVNNFADRIIEISDGIVVSDKKNQSNYVKYEIKEEYDICLSEMPCQKINVSDNTTINIYGQAKEIDLIFNNDEIIIRNKKGIIETSINKKIVDDKPDYIEQNILPENNNIVNIFEKLKHANPNKKQKRNPLLFYKNMPKLKKVAAIILFFSAIFVAISMSYFGKAVNIDELKYRYSDKNSLTVFSKMSVETLKTLDELEYVQAILPYQYGTYYLKMYQPNYYESTNSSTENYLNVSAKPLPISLITNDDIIIGKMPENNYECVIDKSYIDKLFNEYEASMYGKGGQLGIISYKGYLGCEIVLYDNVKIKIVGISNNITPTIYMQEDIIYIMSLKLLTKITENIYTEKLIDFVETDITFENTYQVYISEKEFKESGFATDGNNYVTIGTDQFKIKGYYIPKDKTDKQNGYIISSEALKRIIYNSLSEWYSVEIIVNNADEDIQLLLNDMKVYSRNTYLDEAESYIKNQKSAMVLQLIFTIIMLLLTFVIYYMVTKSMVISEKRAIAIKCALGKKKIKIFIEFILRTIFFTTIFALPVYLIANLFIKYVLKNAGGIFTMMSITFENFMFGIILLYLITIVSTILPILKYKNKTASYLLKN